MPDWVLFLAEPPGFCKKWLARRGRNGRILLKYKKAAAEKRSNMKIVVLDGHA